MKQKIKVYKKVVNCTKRRLNKKKLYDKLSLLFCPQFQLLCCRFFSESEAKLCLLPIVTYSPCPWPNWKVWQFSTRNRPCKHVNIGVRVYTEISILCLFIINLHSNNQFFFVYLLQIGVMSKIFRMKVVESRACRCHTFQYGSLAKFWKLPNANTISDIS